MTVTLNNTIRQRGDALRKERLAKSEIRPGMLVQIDADGTYEPHSAADTRALCAIAIEAEIWDQGREMVEPYTTGERVLVDVMQRGGEFQGLMNEACAVGDFLTSAGNGRLKVGTAANAIGTANLAVTAEAVAAYGTEVAKTTGQDSSVIKAAYTVVETW